MDRGEAPLASVPLKHMLLTLQYLEDRPGLAEMPIGEVTGRLRRAFELLPITHLLIGWNVPARMLDGCRDIAAQAGARFYRWHPLLTGDGVLQPRLEWQVVGLKGEPIPGFRGMPEFTFVCPNHPAARSAALERLTLLADGGAYDGIFLDRIRYPSPAGDPVGAAGCFCEHCVREAEAQGLDLRAAQSRLTQLAGSAQGMIQIIRGLLGHSREAEGEPTLDLLLGFRQSSITSMAASASDMIHQAGLEVGLDCFAPSLTRMVGQDLGELGAHAEWIKVMTYAHTLGPAGLPFEFLGLLDALVSVGGQAESEALALLCAETGLELPATRLELERGGFSAAALAREVERAVAATDAPVLAGIELVSIPGVTEPAPHQLTSDLHAVRQAGPAGLAVSWDLLDIPEENLEIARQVWL